MAFAGVGFCSPMQLPGPTLIVNEGTTVTVTLTNNLSEERGIHGHGGTEAFGADDAAIERGAGGIGTRP